MPEQKNSGGARTLLQSHLQGEKVQPKPLDGGELELLQLLRATLSECRSQNGIPSSGHKNKLEGWLDGLGKRLGAAKKLSQSIGVAVSSQGAATSASANNLGSTSQPREGKAVVGAAVGLSIQKATSSNLSVERRAELTEELSYVNESIGLLEKNYGPEQGWVYLRSYDIISDEYVNKKTQEYNRLVDQKAQMEKTLGIS